MNRILKVAGRPCSCPEGRVCSACTATKANKFRLKPRIHVTTPRNPHIPITVTRFHERPALVKIKESLSSLRIRRSPKKEPGQSLSNISRWYGKRKALREQKKLEEKERKSFEKEKKQLRKAQKQFEKEHKKEQNIEKKLLHLEQIENAKLEREKLQKERENEVLKYYKEQEEHRRLQEKEREKARQVREKEVLQHFEKQEEHLKSYYTPQLRAETAPYYKVEDGKEKKVKEKKVKEKKVKEKKVKKEKPKKLATDKTVFVKTFNRRESWRNRFSRWFYRFCCQLYCYITCVLAVVFVLIFII